MEKQLYMKKSTKENIMIVVGILGVTLGVLFITSRDYVYTGTEYIGSSYDLEVDYFNDKNIGNYEDIYFEIFRDDTFVFRDYSSTLIATYSLEEYKKQVTTIQREIPFLEGKEDGVYSDFKIGKWDFKVCDFENSVYPKYFAMIAFCEEENKIAYLEVYAIDLDLVPKGDEEEEPMQKFVKNQFHYDFT